MNRYRRISLAVFFYRTLGGFEKEQPSVDETIMRLRAAKLSLRTIGSRVGLSYATVHNRLKKLRAA